jgi:hypothetical protein
MAIIFLIYTKIPLQKGFNNLPFEAIIKQLKSDIELLSGKKRLEGNKFLNSLIIPFKIHMACLTIIGVFLNSHFP